MCRVGLVAVLLILSSAGVVEVRADLHADISDPEPLNANAGTDIGGDGSAQLTTDGLGNWVAVWWSNESAIGGGIGPDSDILDGFAHIGDDPPRDDRALPQLEVNSKAVLLCRTVEYDLPVVVSARAIGVEARPAH